jgi:L-lactate dehydrogenase (cytochrome)/(S)-mandelate dehydrogenase
MLAPICAAAGDKLAVMLDGGVRRGGDILVALCLGARFVFVGRATLYGAAAGGLPGAQKAIDILRKEIDLVMAQMGCPALTGLGPGCLLQPPAPPMRTEVYAEPDGAAAVEERRLVAEKVAQR